MEPLFTHKQDFSICVDNSKWSATAVCLVLWVEVFYFRASGILHSSVYLGWVDKLSLLLYHVSHW